MIDPSAYTPEQSSTILWLTNKIVGLGIGASFSKLEVGPVVS